MIIQYVTLRKVHQSIAVRKKYESVLLNILCLQHKLEHRNKAAYKKYDGTHVYAHNIGIIWEKRLERKSTSSP